MIRFCKCLITPVLVGLAVLASTLPKAYGQSRAMHMRPSFPMRPFTVNGTTIHQRTPIHTTTHQTTPFVSQRDRRFDQLMRADRRFDRFLGTGASFGVGGLSAGVMGSSGITAYPVPYPAYALT